MAPGPRPSPAVIVSDRESRARLAVLDVPRYPIHELATRDDGQALTILHTCGAYGGYEVAGEQSPWGWRLVVDSRPVVHAPGIRQLRLGHGSLRECLELWTL